jgi:putative radical SAM enzyme (TIGR03279 family)
MPPARVLSVAPGSPAARAGLDAGDEVVTVNGDDLRDVIAYQLHTDGPRVELEVRRGGLERLVVVEKSDGAPLGLEVEHAVFDRVRTCDNHCPFCFIYQLPKGVRKSLYLKDDDYRLSFLYGNFTTLTRFTEADLERVITERLGPLFVSIHATDPDVRTRLLRNRRGGTSLRWLELLLDAGIEVHGQVVVCPGINDGTVLDQTLRGVLERFPSLTTLGVVPLGVSAHNREPEMRPHAPAEAAADLDTIERWQARYTAALGHRLVYASDEYYLLAARPFPALVDYDGCPQHENGIGMARTFEAEVRAALHGDAVDATGVRRGFFAWVDGAPAEGYRAPRHADVRLLPTRRPTDTPVTILTSTLGARVLEPLLPELPGDVRLCPVSNEFFGGNIGVTGLLTGADLARVLADAPADHRYLLPDVALSRDRFLDGTTLSDLPRPVEVVPTDGASLVAALRARAA